ncbi:cupin domain-containing protein [Thermohalobacter berrensis]|nr:cupin domain-containing protein [Thermohalobacter berrensis]
MYNFYRPYPCPYTPMYNLYYRRCPYPYWFNTPMYNSDFWKQPIELKDYGPEPFVVNIDEATKQNTNYRTALWTGENLQVTLMSIKVGGDIGLEIHPTVDQFIRIEEGQGIVRMGDSKDNLDFEARVYDDYAIMIPAGKWHNLINTGSKPLKLYAIYAPPEHPRGTIHKTKEDAEADERNYSY